MTQVTIKGASASDLLKFIDYQIEEEKLDEKSFIKKPEFTERTGETGMMDLVSLFLEIDKAVLVELIADCIIWLIKGKDAKTKKDCELIVTKTDSNGAEVKYEIRNMPKEEILHILKNV